jgi:hypothetical protein
MCFFDCTQLRSSQAIGAYICIYMYIYTYIYTLYVCIYMCIYMCVYNACIYTYIKIHEIMYTYVYMCIYRYIYIYIYIMYIYIHTHIFITPSRLKLGVLRVEMSSVHGSRHEAEHCRERLKPQSYASVMQQKNKKL